MTDSFQGPVTPQELDEVFGWALVLPDCLVVDRVPLKEQIGSIIVPEGSRRTRQTGSTHGTVIQIGQEAQNELDIRMAPLGRKIKVGDRVSFSVYAPLPIGLLDSGDHPILPGFDSGRYACIELLKWADVVGHVKQERIK